MSGEGGDAGEGKEVKTPFDELYGGDVKPEDLQEATKVKVVQADKKVQESDEKTAAGTDQREAKDGQAKGEVKENTDRQLTIKEARTGFVEAYIAFLRKINGPTVEYDSHGNDVADLAKRGWQIEVEDDGSWGGYNVDDHSYFNVSPDKCRVEVGTSGSYNSISHGVIEGNYNDVIMGLGKDAKKVPLSPGLTHKYLKLLREGKHGFTFDYRAQTGEFDSTTGKGRNFKDIRPPKNSVKARDGVMEIIKNFK